MASLYVEISLSLYNSFNSLETHVNFGVALVYILLNILYSYSMPYKVRNGIILVSTSASLNPTDKVLTPNIH